MSKSIERRGSWTRRIRRVLACVVVCAVCVFGSGALAAGGVVATPAASMHVPKGAGAPTAPREVEVAPVLYRSLASGGRRDFAIEFRERADLSDTAAMSWQARGREVYARLRETADRSQASVRRVLDAQRVPYEAHWIKNTILVRGGDLPTLRALSSHSEVLRIRDLPHAKLIEPDHPAQRGAAAVAGIGDNIHWIGADTVWSQGTNGDGVTIGVIDTGVLYTHEAIRQQYRGWQNGSYSHDYNWFDPTAHSSEPISADPHGSHVIGTVVGDDRNPDEASRNRIGVAPGADWIACLGLPLDGDSNFSLLACGEFMLAPTKTDGSAANPDKRPASRQQLVVGRQLQRRSDLVLCRHGRGMGRSRHFPGVRRGQRAELWFAEPPGLSTVSSPASLGTAFAVGSTGNHDGAYAEHSNWGPTSDAAPGLPVYPDPRGYPNLKPQVVAPGVDIRSAVDFGNNEYATMTGTSMSSPHITGLVALMLEAGECLAGDYATLGTLIMQTARPIPYETGGVPPPGPGSVPNYATGWGEIDAPRAVDAAANACGPQGSLRGTVTSTSGTPIANAKVEIFVDEAVRVYEITTEADGHFVRRLPANTSGGYTVRVSAYGYMPNTETGVLVTVDTTTTHDVALPIAPTYKIDGRVTDSATGWPLHAKVFIGGYPGGAIWTDPVSGRYSVRLPDGSAYRFDVASDVPGYVASTREIASVTGGGTQDFALDGDKIACTAPGYAYASTAMTQNFEANGNAPPSGWTSSSAGLGWLFGDATEISGPTFPFTEHGRFAAVVDELGADGGWGNDGRFDYLVSPSIAVPNGTPVLRFKSFFVDTSSNSATVEASSDGGATWIALGVPKSDPFFAEWRDEAISLAPVAGATVKLRFHSNDGTEDEFACSAGRGRSTMSRSSLAVRLRRAAGSSSATCATRMTARVSTAPKCASATARRSSPRAAKTRASARATSRPMHHWVRRF